VKLAFTISSAAILAALCTVGCTVGPNYHRADAPAATHWDVAEPWRESAPKDALGKGDWWEVFRDDDLNGFEHDALQSNQTIKVSVARLEQARALAAVQISTQFPQFSTGLSPERQRLSGNRPANSSFTVLGPITQNSYTLPFTVNYELDIFGRRRRSIEAAQASYQSNAADLENVRLLITSELAGDFFSLRQLDTQISLLSRTVDALSKGLDLVNSRYHGGVASGLDVAQEETLLDTTRTQLTLLNQQRKQFEDAVAVLVGKSAPDFHITPRELSVQPPTLNAGLPSDLLERRPDIAEAEREMAVANAQIGMTDDPCAYADIAVVSARAHRANAIGEFDLAERPKYLGTIRSCERMDLHVNGGDNFVTGSRIGQIVVQQVSQTRSGEQVVMRIDDRNVRVKDGFIAS